MLLETQLRHGNLSYDGKDLVKREETWEPPPEIVESLKKRYESTSKLKVKLVARQNEVVLLVGGGNGQYFPCCTIS